MKKLLSERFQELAGLKPLYTLKEEIDLLPRDNEDDAYYVVYQSLKDKNGTSKGEAKEFKKFPFTDESSSKSSREDAERLIKNQKVGNSSPMKNGDKIVYNIGVHNPLNIPVK